VFHANPHLPAVPSALELEGSNALAKFLAEVVRRPQPWLAALLSCIHRFPNEYVAQGGRRTRSASVPFWPVISSGIAMLAPFHDVR